MLGNRVGTIHPNSINQKCIVAQRYLKFRVENLYLVGFFMDRADGNDIWIQFNFERLADFCYKCGMLNHVTGKCKFGEPAIITSPNGISAKVFGPWLKLQEAFCLLIYQMRRR